MESVLAFASRPTTFSSDDKRESDSGEAEVKEKDEKKSSRKRRYSSEDRSFEKENDYHVGSRYWGGSVEQLEDISKATKKTKEIDPILTEEEDQFTHVKSVQDDDLVPEDILNVFTFENEYEGNEEKYQAARKEILGQEGDEAEGSDESASDASEDSDDEEEDKDAQAIADETETNFITLRWTIYLTIQRYII